MAILGRTTNKEPNRGLPLDEIKDKLDILEIATRLYPGLKKLGGIYKGDHGQIHSSQSGSCLAVYQETNSWVCWHCKKGGDIFYLLGIEEFGPSYSGRGEEFRRVVEIAAELAGIELAPVSETEQKRAEEQNRLYNILTETARYWHNRLMDDTDDGALEILDWVKENYGFTEEFIKRKLIGFAPIKDNGRLLKHLVKLGYSEEEARSAAVVNKGNYARFQGRVTFPYWAKGQVRYFAARKTRLTPNLEHEQGKYLKLKVSDPDNPQISPFIQNDVLLGLDTLKEARKLGRVLITEGAPDQLAAEQAGEPCISPVTVRFKSNDIPRLITAVKDIRQVYLCNDNEKSQAGEEGVLDTASKLEEQNIAVLLIHLPRPEGIEKIDVCDFIRDQGAKTFSELYRNALRLPHYLARYSRPEGENDVHRFLTNIALKSQLCRYDPVEIDGLQRELATNLKLKLGLVGKVFKAAQEETKKEAKDPEEKESEIESATVLIPELEVDRFEKIMSNPPVFELYLKGIERPVKLATAELLDFTIFRNRIAEVSNIVILHPLPPKKKMSKVDTWGMAVKELLKKVVEVEAPEDASEEYQIGQRIRQMLTSEHMLTEERVNIELSKVWPDEKSGIYWFKGADLIQHHLKAYMEKVPDSSQIWQIFKSIGGISKVLKVGKSSKRCWGLKINVENGEEMSD
jgi:DNA primase